MSNSSSRRPGGYGYLHRSTSSDNVDSLDSALSQLCKGLFRDVRRLEHINIFEEHPRDVESDIPLADDDGLVTASKIQV